VLPLEQKSSALIGLPFHAHSYFCKEHLSALPCLPLYVRCNGVYNAGSGSSAPEYSISRVPPAPAPSPKRYGSPSFKLNKLK